MRQFKGLVPVICVAVGMAVYAISPAHHQLFCSGAMFQPPALPVPATVP